MDKLKFKAISDCYLPQHQTALSAGLDVKTTSHLTILPGQSVKFGTGVMLESCPPKACLFMELRSSMRFKKGLTQLGVGLIDGDYRDEIRGLIYNTTNETVHIEEGERIAQLIPQGNVLQLLCSDDLYEGKPVSEERTGGIGSTGK